MKSVTVFAFERLCDLTFIPCSGSLWGGGGNSTYYVKRTCHFARKIGTHNSVNSGGF